MFTFVLPTEAKTYRILFHFFFFSLDALKNKSIKISAILHYLRLTAKILPEDVFNGCFNPNVHTIVIWWIHLPHPFIRHMWHCVRVVVFIFASRISFKDCTCIYEETCPTPKTRGFFSHLGLGFVYGCGLCLMLETLCKIKYVHTPLKLMTEPPWQPRLWKTPLLMICSWGQDN